MLLRLAHTQKFVLPSPDKSQVASQPALQALPLIMEPESMLYTSPVVVLAVLQNFAAGGVLYGWCAISCPRLS